MKSGVGCGDGKIGSPRRARWMAAGRPAEGWVWPAPTQVGHIDHSTLKKQRNRAVRQSKVRKFVLYNLRHTFLTRLGESGCDAWTLARIAGNSSIAISSRYVQSVGGRSLGSLLKDQWTQFWAQRRIAEFRLDPRLRGSV